MLTHRCDTCNNWEQCVFYFECTRKKFEKQTTDDPELRYAPGELNKNLSDIKPEADSMLEFWRLHLKGEA